MKSSNQPPTNKPNSTNSSAANSTSTAAKTVNATSTESLQSHLTITKGRLQSMTSLCNVCLEVLQSAQDCDKPNLSRTLGVYKNCMELILTLSSTLTDGCDALIILAEQSSDVFPLAKRFSERERITRIFHKNSSGSW